MQGAPDEPDVTPVGRVVLLTLVGGASGLFLYRWVNRLMAARTDWAESALGILALALLVGCIWVLARTLSR